MHGEAVAAGMICEAYLSVEKCGLSIRNLQNIVGYLLEIYGKTLIDSNEINAIVNFCQQDKKNEKGLINFSLLEEIGSPVFNMVVEQSEIRKAIQRYSLL